MESLEQKEDAIAEKKQQAEAFLLEAEGIKANQLKFWNVSPASPQNKQKNSY